MDLRGWALKSRVRYATVVTLANLGGIFGIMALGGGLSRGELLWAIPVFPLAFLVHGWVWYPRARRRLGGL